MEPAPERVSFPNISPEAFQHRDDVKASEVLVNTPGFGQVIRHFSGGLTEKGIRLHLLSHAIRIGPKQAPEIWKQFIKAAEALAIEDLPELYVTRDADRNAFAMGIKKPTITMTSALVDSLTEIELLAVLGHELGHVKCRHMVHKTIAFTFAEYGGNELVNMIPGIGGLLTAAIYAPLFHWSRMAEISCDRAALLVVQDPEAVARVLAKFGGWAENFGPIDFDGLQEQAKEYDDLDNDTMSAVLKVINKIQSGIYLTHPLPIQRVRQILQWSQGDQYQDILAGNYAKAEVNATVRRCSTCGGVLNPGDKHCPACGTAQTEVVPGLPTCTKCGRPVAVPRPKFCPGCGNNFSEPGSVAD